MTTFLVFGDSIAYGAWDFSGGGWANRLRRALDKKTSENPEKCFLVYNLSVDSEFTSDVLNRFESECRSRLKGSGEDLIVVFAVGINDSMFIREKNDFYTTEKGFRENLERLVKLARRFTPIILFVGMTPVDESKMDPSPWYPAGSYRNEYVRKFDNIIEEMCKKEDVLFVKIFDSLAEDYKNLLEDGLHPNSKGHSIIYRMVHSFLIENRLV